MKKKKSKQKEKRSIAELERLKKILLSGKVPPQPVSTKKLKLKRPPVRKFFINTPIDQPLSDIVGKIKAGKLEDIKVSNISVPRNLVSFFVTENEEDILHRK